MKRRFSSLLMLIAALTALLAAPAWGDDACSGVAGNLIVNCGFETGDLTGWTLTGNTSNSGVGTGWAYSGTYGAFLGPIGSDGYLSQTVAGNTLTFAFRQDPEDWGLDSVVVTPFVSCGPGCETYFVSFMLENVGGTPNDFTMFWNGVDVGPSLVDASGFGYTQFSGYVDGLAGGSVPEPGSLLLMGSGVLGIAGIVRRKLLL